MCSVLQSANVPPLTESITTPNLTFTHKIE
jgi:hypothetical protein